MPSIPKPFEAPSVSLTRHEKEWKDVLPSQLSVDDHILNFGIVKEIREGSNGLEFIISGQSLPISFVPDLTLRAFTQGN